jgi:hypothetical protein
MNTFGIFGGGSSGWLTRVGGQDVILANDKVILNEVVAMDIWITDYLIVALYQQTTDQELPFCFNRAALGRATCYRWHLVS